jgi:membrane associated rhomboid family serine protease
MNQASVGFQCPDCVREGRASVRETRTSFGGRMTGGPPVVTITLIAINVAFFVIAHATGPDRGRFVLNLEQWTYGFPPIGIEGVALGAYWQLITATFLHVDLIHIALNMLGVWLFGTFLERELGRWRFLALYLLSGLCGSVAMYLLTGPASGPSLGASGSVFGLFGAAFVILLKQRRDVTQLVVLLAINLFYSFTAANIAWQAHIGGLIAGVVMGAGFSYAPRRHRTLVQIVMLVTVLALCVVAVVVRTAVLTV